MTEPEWTTVVLAFTRMFDTLKVVAPEKIDVQQVETAGRILITELQRIRALQAFRMVAFRGQVSHTGTEQNVDWQRRNEELEKKKQAEYIQETQSLEDTLRASIKEAERKKNEGQ